MEIEGAKKQILEQFLAGCLDTVLLRNELEDARYYNTGRATVVQPSKSHWLDGAFRTRKGRKRLSNVIRPK